MNVQPFNLEFVDLVPDYEAKKFIYQIADRIHLCAPSQSTMNIIFQGGQELVHASCKIVSSVGEFAAEAQSTNPKYAIQELEEILKEQFAIWKKARFSKEGKQLAVS